MNIFKQIKLYQDVKKSIPENPKINFGLMKNRPITDSNTYKFVHENPEFYVEAVRVFVSGKYLNEDCFFAEIQNKKQKTKPVKIKGLVAELLYKTLSKKRQGHTR